MSEIDINLIISDYLFFLIFVIFLALVIVVSVKSIVWLALKLGVIKVWPFV
jgi:hypothetical protein